MALDFGFYPRRYDRTIGDIVIATLPELNSKIEFVNSHEWTERGWISVPHRKRVFRLPKTHSITYAQPTSDEHVQFLLWCFGLFVGMRMSWTEAGFLDATPIEERAMIDIVWNGDSLEKAISGADAFWHKHAVTNPRIAKVLAGAIHAYFLAQTRDLLEFEKFIYLYMALDACYRVHMLLHPPVSGSPYVKHEQRIEYLCRAYSIAADHKGATVPAWADPSAQLNIADVRNAAFHEGLFCEAPLGFQGFDDPVVHRHVPQHMVALASRLIVGLLGLAAKHYIQSPITSRMMEGVQL